MVSHTPNPMCGVDLNKQLVRCFGKALTEGGTPPLVKHQSMPASQQQSSVLCTFTTTTAVVVGTAREYKIMCSPHQPSSADITWFFDSPYCTELPFPDFLALPRSFAFANFWHLFGLHAVFFLPFLFLFFLAFGGSFAWVVPLKAEQIRNRMMCWGNTAPSDRCCYTHVEGIDVSQPVLVGASSQGGMTQIFNGCIVGIVFFCLHTHGVMQNHLTIFRMTMELNLNVRLM